MPTLGSAILQLAGFRPGASGIIFQANNSYDIGDSAATGKPRDLWLGRNAAIGGTLGVTGVATFANGAVGAPGVNLGDATTGFYRAALNYIRVASAGAAVFSFEPTLVESYVAFKALSAVLDQGSGDGEILALKSSDVAHGMTNEAGTTDTYASMGKYSGTEGGLMLEGFSEADVGVYVPGNVTTDNTTKSTSAIGAVLFNANKKSGAGVNSMGANANLCVIRNYTAAAFIFDAEGSGHADVEWTTF